MLTDLGFVDTLAQYGPRIYTTNPADSVANQFAAMPSLHFGWAVIVALCVTFTFRARWVRLVWLHPAITLLAIVVTGNHYWIDAIVAGLLVALGELAWRLRGAVFLHSQPRPSMPVA